MAAKGKTYKRASGEMIEVVEELVMKYHDRLLDCNIEVLLVYAAKDKYGEPKGPAITLRGKAAYACVRATTLEERVAGRGDAIIWVDGDDCGDWPDSRLRAIMDHELTHLEIVENSKTGMPENDDLGRPKVQSQRSRSVN